MKEKEIMMHPNDLGNDVASVQRLQRHHETIEYDMIALKDKVAHSVTVITHKRYFVNCNVCLQRLNASIYA